MNWKNYNEISDKIETGDLYFTASPALFSRIIRFFTRAKISHVGMFLVIGERRFTVECLEGKNCIMSLASVRLEDVPLIFIKTRTIIEPETLVTLALQDINKVEYDLWGAILSLFVDTKSKQQFCSEWIAKILDIHFYYLERGVTPVDLLTYFIKNND